jgi:hypothetical protein
MSSAKQQAGPRATKTWEGAQLNVRVLVNDIDTPPRASTEMSLCAFARLL